MLQREPSSRSPTFLCNTTKNTEEHLLSPMSLSFELAAGMPVFFLCCYVYILHDDFFVYIWKDL